MNGLNCQTYFQKAVLEKKCAMKIKMIVKSSFHEYFFLNYIKKFNVYRL